MNELIKLEAYLEENNISYRRHLIASAANPEDKWNQLVIYKDGNHWFDVVWHKYSIGYEDGLLELLDLENDAEMEGYLTADDVIRRYFENEKV